MVREPRAPRSSLRSELLFNLSFLAAAALMLALWTASVLPVSFATIGLPQWLFIGLVVVDILVFVLLGLAGIGLGRGAEVERGQGAKLAIGGLSRRGVFERGQQAVQLSGRGRACLNDG